MAPAKSTKPPYVNATGRSGPPDLASAPPFVFNGVTTRAFPIKANLAKLTQFCDDYLNLDQNIVQFRPSLPFVYLMVLNYGSMSSASVQAQNVGWVAQHEVAFMIPLERWCWDGKGWVFRNWACVSPFIFVDDELSQTTGREVYGWPKIVGEVEKNVPLWATDPRSPTRVFSLQIPVFPKLFAGAREELRDFIQIDRDPVPRFSEFPLDSGNPWNPLTILPHATRSWLGLMGVSLDLLVRSPARGYRGSWDWGTLRGMLGASGRSVSTLLPDVSGFLPALAKELFAAADRPRRRGNSPDTNPSEGRLSFETITLKQFRDTQKPEQACYQAIVSSPMSIDRLNRCGLLGDYNLIRGDVSGGYTIRIHRYAVQPIIESLGLEVAGVEEGNDVPVAVLKPTLPFWTDVDLHYGLGEVLCSRAQCFHRTRSCTEWKREGTTEAACPEPQSAAATTVHAHCDTKTSEPPQHIPYNTAQGGATQPIAGPFHFPDVTVQVYPLLADRSRLAVFLDEYLNQPLCPEGAKPVGMKLEPFGSYVYLMVAVQGGQIGVMWSEANNIGWWADKEVSFAVPVKCYRRTSTGDSWELISLGMVSPFVFGNSGRAVITDREVNGRPSVKAEIESPADAWLTPSGPIEERRLLKLETEVFPALHLGQRAEQRTLLEIDGKDVMATPYHTDDAQWGAMLEHWGEKFVQELRCKTLIHEEFADEIDNACALAREILCFDAPLNSLHLKQYRDASEPDKACYQALVKTSRHVTRLYDLQEIQHRIHVRLHKYPGFPIAETFGLKVKHVDSKGGEVVQVLEPVRPFWMRVGLREHLGQVLCWRTEQRQWTPNHPWVPDSPDVTGPDEQPFFASAGHTGVVPSGSQDGAAALDRQAVKSLHRELNAELAAMIADGPTQFLDALAAVSGGMERGDRAATESLGRSLGAMPARELYPLIEAISNVLRDRGPAPRSDRLSRTEAGRALDRLPEAQVVIESWLTQRAADTNAPKAPPHFIRKHSLPQGWAHDGLSEAEGDVWTPSSKCSL